MISVKIYDPPELNIREIMRYARIRGADNTYAELIDECVKEAEPYLSYRVCYSVLDVVRENGTLVFGGIRTASKTVSKAIKDAEKIILFAATVGAPFDRLINKYSRISPSKALVLQAVGAERVESLCDMFCDEMNTELCAKGKRLTPRVSPGYGDIGLEMQRDIFAVLDCPRKIGLTLDESLLMSPSKSVTAICGISDSESCISGAENDSGCSECGKTDCIYRKQGSL